MTSNNNNTGTSLSSSAASPVGGVGGVDDAQRRRQAAVEMDRRSAVVEKARGRAQGASATRPSHAIPFDRVAIPGQDLFLVHLAHHHLRPHSNTPGIRVCGVFETQEDLVSHATTHKQSFQDCDIWAFQRGEMFLICSTREKMTNLNYRQTKAQKLLDLHGITAVKQRESEWQNDRKRKTAVGKDKIGKSSFAQRRKATTNTTRVAAIEQKVRSECGGKVDREFPMLAEKRNQKVVVWSYLHDITEEVLSGKESPEPLVVLWAVFGDEQAAKDWITKSASRAIVNLVMDVVVMYEFIPIEMVDDSQIKTTYRHEEQENIMSSRLEEVDKVRRFRDHCAQNDMTVPETTIEVDEQQVEEDGVLKTKAVTKVTKSARPFEARGQAASTRLTLPDQVSKDTDELAGDEENDAEADRKRAENALRWTNHGTALKPVEDYYPGDETTETLQARLDKKASPEDSVVNPAAAKRAQEIGLENYRVASSPFLDVIGLPGSMLNANADCVVRSQQPIVNTSHPLTRTPAPNGGFRIPPTTSTPALIK